MKKKNVSVMLMCTHIFLSLFPISSISFFLQWRCCGVMNHNDWYVALHENVVPESCCQHMFPGCGRNASNSFWTRVSHELKFCMYICTVCQCICVCVYTVGMFIFVYI